MNGDAPEYLTLAEVADLLRVSTRTVRRLAKDPRTPVLRLKGTVRFPRQRFLDHLHTIEQGRGGRRRPTPPKEGPSR